jgi:hypothetical protein
MIKMGRTCRTRGTEDECIQVLVGKSRGRKPLGRPRGRWEEKVKMDFTEIGRERWLDSSGSGKRPMAGYWEQGHELSVPWKVEKFLCVWLLKKDSVPWSCLLGQSVRMHGYVCVCMCGRFMITCEFVGNYIKGVTGNLRFTLVLHYC